MITILAVVQAFVGCDLAADVAPPDPRIVITSREGPAPLPVSFEDAGADAAEVSERVWDLGDGATSSHAEPTHTYEQPGRYIVTLTVRNGAGTASDSVAVVVASPPRRPPRVRFAATPETGAAPVEVRFRDESTRFPSHWTWDFGDGGTSTEREPVHVYRRPGTYTVTLTATNVAGSATRTFRRAVRVTRRDPVLVGAGDIADCSDDGDERTAALLDDTRGTVFTVGDNVYPEATREYLRECYAHSWGRHRDRTRIPVLGNHDYVDGRADAYFDYFGDRAGPRDKGYYSRDVGAWHVVVLNSNCEVVACGPGAEQLAWLAQDLADNEAECTLALWHAPRFSSGAHSGVPYVAAFWEYLYHAGVDLVVNGHDHNYERFAPQRPDGTLDESFGITQIVAGTGGKELRRIGSPAENSLVRDDTSVGVLKLTLRNGSADFEFLPAAGDSFTDRGSIECHGEPPQQLEEPEAQLALDVRDGASPLTVSFRDESAGEPSAWLWEFGDGHTAAERHPLHTYTKQGTYDVRLTVANPAGLSETTHRRLVTVGPPLPTRRYDAAVLASEPVGYWRLGDASASDATETIDGETVGGVVRHRGTPVDGSRASRFDGRTGWIRIEDHSGLRADSDFSVEAWARPTALAGGDGMAVLQKGEDGGYPQWEYRLAVTGEGQWRGTVFSGDEAVAVTAPEPARPGHWVHLALVKAGESLRLYVDGRLVDHTVVDTDLNETTGPLGIGRAGGSPVDYFNGSIAEVAIYERALSTAEVWAHYRSAG